MCKVRMLYFGEFNALHVMPKLNERIIEIKIKMKIKPKIVKLNYIIYVIA